MNIASEPSGRTPISTDMQRPVEAASVYSYRLGRAKSPPAMSPNTTDGSQLVLPASWLEKGLVYRKKASPELVTRTDNTVLANEQVDRRPVLALLTRPSSRTRDSPSWFLGITDYARRTARRPRPSSRAAGPSRVLSMQAQLDRSSSVGAEIYVPAANSRRRRSIKRVYTTRPDTVFGVTLH